MLLSLDLENLIEEVSDLSRREKKKLKNLLIKLFEHLLKLTYWRATPRRRYPKVYPLGQAFIQSTDLFTQLRVLGKRCDPAASQAAKEAVRPRVGERRKGMLTKRRAPRERMREMTQKENITKDIGQQKY